MPNYAETTADGVVTTWRAAKLIQGFNDYGITPCLEFHEVTRRALNGKLIGETYTGRRLPITLANPDLIIPHIDPATYQQILDADGAPIPGRYFTAQEAEFVLACIYIAAAVADDRANPPPPDTPDTLEDTGSEE